MRTAQGDEMIGKEILDTERGRGSNACLWDLDRGDMAEHIRPWERNYSKICKTTWCWHSMFTREGLDHWENFTDYMV